MTARAAMALVLDGRYLAWSAAAAAVGLIAFGVAGAIIPNPVFGRQIPPEPFAIATWIASGLLVGLLAGTYLAPATAAPASLARHGGSAPEVDPGNVGAERRTSVVAYAGGLAAFLAIGCPVCNKVALVLLGTSGALSIWAPLQPLIAIASLLLLAGALAWRLRLRARGNACPTR